MTEFRKANEDEAEECYRVLDEARTFQRRNGLHQWTDSYPSLLDVLNDIRRGTAYVLLEDGRIEGYLCLSFDGEKAYEDPTAHFRLQAPYGVIHRLAVAEDAHGKGYAGKMLNGAEEIVRRRNVPCVRIDTHPDNAIMRRLLKKNGYEECGFVKIHGIRIAYDKIL